MILTRQITQIRDAKGLIRGAQTRLQGVWRDPLAEHVVVEYWTPLQMEVEQLEAQLMQHETAIDRNLSELRALVAADR